MNEDKRPRSGRMAALFPYGVYLLSMLLAGIKGPVVAQISLSSGQIALLRTFFGGAVLALLVLLLGGFDREAVRAEARLLLLGAVAIAANWATVFEAYRLLNVSLATLIAYVGPMLLLLLSPMLFHEKLTGTKIAAGCIVAVGLVCISGSIALGGLSVPGLLVSILSALCYAALIVINKRIAKTPSIQMSAIELSLAALVLLPYVLFTAGLPHPQRADLPFILVLVLVNTGLGFGLYSYGLKKLPGQSVALLSYVDPVSSLLFSALLLHEKMTPLQLLGAVLIIGGAVLGELRRRK